MTADDDDSATKQPKAKMLSAVQAREETKAGKTRPKPGDLRFSAA
jgi:hypothetical protein